VVQYAWENNMEMHTTMEEESKQLSDLSRQALAFYNAHLKNLLEPQQNGRGIAIHPASGDYVVADTPTQAGHAMRQRHPEGEFLMMRIGGSPEPSLAARFPVRQPTTGQKA
jgi:hypothetical protein